MRNKTTGKTTRLKDALYNIGATEEPNLTAVFEQQSVDQRAFHQSEIHGEVALSRIKSSNRGKESIKSIVKQGKPLGLTQIQAEALLDIIGLTHDAIYHIDGRIKPNAMGAIMKVMDITQNGLVFNPQSSATSITCQIVQEIQNNPAIAAIKESSVTVSGYGIAKTEGGSVGIIPTQGFGQNELFSAVIAEQIMQDAGVRKEMQVIVIASILNTVPFTSQAYQEHFERSVEEVARIVCPQPQQQAKTVASVAKLVDHTFTNYFDISNYQDGQRLAAYAKLMDMEQKPEINDMVKRKKEDHMLIAACSLDNYFHERILKPNVANGNMLIFRGEGNEPLNKKAQQSMEYEIEFKKARAVGAYLQAAVDRHMDPNEVFQSLTKGAGTKDRPAGNGIKVKRMKIIEDLFQYQKPIEEGGKVPRGYKSDALATRMIMDHGLDKVLQAADTLTSKLQGVGLKDKAKALKDHLTKTPQALRSFASRVTHSQEPDDMHR